MSMSIADAVTFFSELKVADAVRLVKELESRWGVSAEAVVAVAAAPAAGPAEVVEEQTEFTVMLEGFGEKKIEVIKVVRAITGLGLKEAKDLVEGAPKPIKEGVSRDDAQAMKKQLEEVGAAVSLK